MTYKNAPSWERFCLLQYNYMSKKTKKRNKPYRGADAAANQPVVHRYTAVQRSALGEWWQGKKKLVKILGIVGAVLLFLIWMIVEIIRIIL